ncbi:hypothetical protein C5167_037348 [Papaver somniferum]|uniref:Magnesium transporter n=1 Tax=Papaver somniferum TaxID=3469 RepID=A0A4Y7I658_PAPSO|nr:magnesium transporter MRS2-3-like [Papaver somniferum]RZC44407.1 hypothetical protein C5167_037348 [Papaver somniferum]
MRGTRPPTKSGFSTLEDETETPVRPPPLGPAGVGANRKKAVIGVRAWLILDSTGHAQLVEVGKHSIMRKTGLPARDLRILDPLLSYPSTVLGREKAIVINLEHIKAIITAQEVLLLNPKDPAVMPFVEEIQHRLLRLYQATKSQEGRASGDEEEWAGLYDLEETRSRSMSPSNYSGRFWPVHDTEEGGKMDGKSGLEIREKPKVLPFEFVALEACLEAACSCLDNEARTLEQEAHPALDKLTTKISTLNLERVRQIKSRLVAITGRVQKVRDELEHLLDDDGDMAEMYLTEKIVQQRADEDSYEGEGIYDRGLQPDMGDRIPAEISLEGNDVPASYEGDLQNPDTHEDLFGMHRAFSRGSHGTHTSTTYSGMSKHLDVEELEMLLEAYFVQIDGTLNKLSTLREYVDDTEDYINIMLDDKQNHLLQMGVVLTTATLVISAFVVVVGIFGMNITIDLFDDKKAGMTEFIWTVGGGATGTIFLYVVAMAWCKHKRLLE